MKRLLPLILLLFVPLVAHAAPAVYPVKEVIGFNDQSLSTKAPAFDGWIKSATLPKLAEDFVAEFAKEFNGIATDKIDPVSKNKVIVASLQLVRASQYTVPKKAIQCTEYHLPITLSVMFTNPATGEVIYSFTRTSYATAEIHDSETPAQYELLLRNAVASNYRNLLSGLIKEARQSYNPTQIEAVVVKVWKKLAILDKGSKFGIALNDTLEDDQANSLQVINVTEDYAVAKTQLGSLQKGQKFSKYANQDTVKAVNKPRVLTMQKGWQDDQLMAISGFFDSEVSKESAFVLMPVNESLGKVLQAVAANTNAGSYDITNQRALPDYLIKFSYAAPRIYDVGEQGKFGFHIYEQYILGELLDKQGRVVYSAIGMNRIEDKDVAGIVFSKEARLEIMLKNAVVQLAEQFSRSIKFSRFVLPVVGLDDKLINLEDSSQELKPGKNVIILKNIGRVEGISGEVLVPTWEVNVVEVNNGKVRVELLMPVTDEVQDVTVAKGDVVILNALTTGKVGESATSVTYCTEIQAKLGTLDMNDFPIISRGFGYLLPYAIFDNDKVFQEKIQAAVRVGGFKVSSLQLGTGDTDGRCLQPVYKAALTNQLTDGKCSVSLAVGYRLYLRQERRGAAASETTLSLNNVQESAFDPTIQCEISKSAVGMLKGNIIKVKYQ